MAKRYIPAPAVWIDQVFNSRQALNDGVVRRSRADVKKYASVSALRARVRQLGFHMVLSGNQYVIFCHKGDLRIVC